MKVCRATWRSDRADSFLREEDISLSELHHLRIYLCWYALGGSNKAQRLGGRIFIGGDASQT